MKTIRTTFKKEGINILTGERCPYNHRLLCDLSFEGAQLISRYFDMHIDKLKSQWNSCFEDEDKTMHTAVASIMLPREMLDPTGAFMRFILFYRYECQAVITTDIQQFGVDKNDPDPADTISRWEQMGCKIYYNPAHGSDHPMSGSVNVHAMTGR